MKPIAKYLPKEISNTTLNVASPEQRHKDIDSLDREILRLAMRINAANYEFLCLVREFDERAGWLKWGLSSCAEWLHWRCDVGLSAAREKIRVAHAIKALPAVTEAFATGSLSYTKVRAMTRVATPENEQILIEYALKHTTSKVEERCRQMRNVDSASVSDARRTHEGRSLRCFRDRERQMMSITVDLPVETGELVMAALDKAMNDETLAAAPTDVDEVREVAESGSLGRDQADALVNLVHAYVDGASVVSPDTRESSNTGFVEDGDALVAMASDSPSTNTSVTNPYHVVLHVDHAVLAADDAKSNSLASSLLARSDLPVETMRRLCCDTAVTHMLDDPNGQPLSVGRKTRVVPTRLKKALWSRDKCCRYPGCHHTRFVDAHHIKHWSRGGETSLDNLVLLCSRHHRLVHEDGYQIHKDQSGEWFFMRPDGRAVPQAGYRRDDVEDELVDLGESNTLSKPAFDGVLDPSREGLDREIAVREIIGSYHLRPQQAQVERGSELSARLVA